MVSVHSHLDGGGTQEGLLFGIRWLLRSTRKEEDVHQHGALFEPVVLQYRDTLKLCSMSIVQNIDVHPRGSSCLFTICITMIYDLYLESEAIHADVHSYLARIPAFHFHSYGGILPIVWIPDWFMGAQEPAGRRSYSFHTSLMDDLPNIGRVIEALGCNLHRIELRFVDSDNWKRNRSSKST